MLKTLKKIRDYVFKSDCNLCNERIYISPFECFECHSTICRDCKSEPYYLYKKTVCTKCNNFNLFKIREVKTVSSEHVGGHKIINVYTNLFSDFNCRDFSETTDNIKYKASKLGANAVISLKQHKKTYRKGTDSGGDYYYSMFSSSGTAVLIRNN